eukprot:TRINITY_DN1521_c0_g3_i1.p1 TRINITY_DN1521_c0_g3~~TRINITY_DN1521_c0_g3_i1.p1  ORF type:complete len:211 (-),score=9.24 TRINITY_DN1521_c0_g3_i1:148-780(-)
MTFGIYQKKLFIKKRIHKNNNAEKYYLNYYEKIYMKKIGHKCCRPCKTKKQECNNVKTIHQNNCMFLERPSVSIKNNYSFKKNNTQKQQRRKNFFNYYEKIYMKKNRSQIMQTQQFKKKKQKFNNAQNIAGRKNTLRKKQRSVTYIIYTCYNQKKGIRTKQFWLLDGLQKFKPNSGCSAQEFFGFSDQKPKIGCSALDEIQKLNLKTTKK